MNLTLKRTAIGAAIAAVIVPFSFAPSAQSGGYEPRKIAGVLRQDNFWSGWYLLSGSHQALGGLGEPRVENGAIVIPMPHTDRINTVICGPDETYAQQGYYCGVSAGYDKLTVKLGRLGVGIDPNVVAAGPYANFWLMGWVEQ